MGLNGLNQYLSGKGFIHGLTLMKDYRVRSSFKHANDFASYMLLFAPAVISGLLLQWYYLGNIFKDNGKEANSFINFNFWPLKIVTIFVSSLSFLTIGWSYSRGAWLGLFTALAVMGLNIRRAIPLLLLAVIVFINIFLPLMKEARDVSFLTDSVYQYEKGRRTLKEGDLSAADFAKLNLNSLKQFGGMGRSGFWKEASVIIHRYPVFGSGLNTYSQINQDRGGGYPHNCYLHMAAETGILGLMSFLWVLYIIFRDGIKYISIVDDKSLKFILIGFIAGLFGFLVHSFFDTNFYSVQLGASFWIVLGIVVALQKIGLSNNAEE